MSSGRKGPPQAKCPIRTDEPCTLCHIGATGPADCPLVYLVMDDEELRAGLAAQRHRVRCA
ncbi:DUF6767 domain-containing protein [Gephyromycinifex aptenodytis]|uniref:DUF6767 domain-containing protein n=1 Tax=Gephyromycinifex aptenodytis TaxID=2716227 RepID=UPI001D02FA47|nr:DUF6767 domain-containing protein [Gephyromycinifex aptenodytis]